MTDSRRSFILRASLAFALAYPAITGFVHPDWWIGYLPAAAFALPIDETVLLHLFAVIEIALAAALLFGVQTKRVSWLVFLMLVLIVIFNLSQFPILFRDLSIAAIALYLALEHA